MDGVADGLSALVAERACEQVIVEFVHRLDLGSPASVAELFTPDGVWEWPAGGRRVRGRAALAEYFGSRPPDRLSRRLCANILVTLAGPERASAVSYFATFRVDGHRGRAADVVASRAPVNVGHYEDELRRVDGVWLIARRRLVLAFGGPTERLGPPRQG